MNWDALGAIAEFVGAIAVLATLVYLAIQVRENSLQVKLGSAINLNHLINQEFDPIYNNDRNIRIWTSGISTPESLSEEDQAIFSLFMARLVHVLLTALMHDNHAILETEVARRYVGSLKSIVESPGGQFWLSDLGGDSQLSENVRDILAEATDFQDFLVTSGKS
jgi:hypothetical protein